ncbi:MAG: DNA methylase [Bacilli bacterium]|nr:DNA methylase [Bacilli bacterium]
MCIDLKSFYASVECAERNLDPLNTNLVVADSSRTDKTICLAVSPSLKSFGLSGRSRLYEVKSKISKLNRKRRSSIKSYNYLDLKNSNIKIDFLIAKPRMKLYMKYSTDIYKIYLKYLSSDDIFVYSIDEVFCDITNYLKYYNMTIRELVTMIITDVYKTTGITATAGIGTNLYLAKVSMDIVAKKVDADENGVRIAFLDEHKYRKYLWDYKPITDFWRVGKGYSKRLAKLGIYTMGDIALKSVLDEDVLYKSFGINAELLIDHAWGYEPCTIRDIKLYSPKSNSISSSQVLTSPYEVSKARIVLKEMVESLSLDLVYKNLVSDTFTITVGYDISSLNKSSDKVKDHYGRYVPKPTHGTVRTFKKTSSNKLILEKFIEFYDSNVKSNLLVRRINISAHKLCLDSNEKVYKQLDIFNFEYLDKSINRKLEEEKLDKKIGKTIINIKNKYGKNSIVKAMDLEEGATTISRNKMVGGHMG